MRIWFTLRKGLLREMFGGRPQTVRAVDGVSFDIHRGEVFCLVGESGCGKTSTGKALLALVPATGGDIFLEAPDRDYAAYEDARQRSKDDPGAARTVEEFRRKYSLTWKETVPWKPLQLLLLVGFLGAGFFVAIFVPALGLGYLTKPYQDSLVTLSTGLLGGGLLGILATLPPTRPSRRTPALLALLALVAVNLMPIVAYRVAASVAGIPAPDAMGSIGNAWNRDSFGLLVATLLGPATAGGLGRAILGMRRQREGLLGVRMRQLRKRLQLIFQDPYESLNPKQSVYEIVSEPLKVNRIVRSPDEASELVKQSLEDAGLRPPEEFMFRFPHELSGGQRQRVSVAAALVLQPEFIVADEPVSMLDVSIRTQILQLMMELRQTRRITYLFITHDLSLAWVLADRIAVMYLGQIVELGTTEQVIGQPKHPYTHALISVVPSPDPRHFSSRMILKGERPDPVDLPAGCRFHPRCPVAFERCGWSPNEVLDALKELAGSGPMAGMLQAAQPDSPLSFRVPPNAQALEAWIREQKATQGQTHLALKALRGITGPPDARRVILHGWDPVNLVEVTPGNEVACLLVKPGHPEAPAIAAA